MNTSTTNIRSQLLCLNLGISCWEARRQDKQVNREVAAQHGTATGVGRYNKELLPDAPEHKAILKHRNAWRVWHYDSTLPWGNDGSRVIRSASFLDYTTEFQDHKAKFEAACEEFYAAYPRLKAEAEFKLNSLFNDSDYPELEQVRNKFRVSMTTFPMPNAEDFRIIDGIPPEEVDRLQAEALEGLNEQVTAAVKELWGRLHTVVAAMQTRLAVGTDDKPLKFHDSLVGNITDLLDRVPRLNLTGDADITAMTEEMRELVVHGPATLRNDMTARSEIADKAKALAARMACFVGD